MITHATPLLTIRTLKTDEFECIDCGDWLLSDAAIYCNCEPPDLLPVCEICYVIHKHYLCDTNPDNSRLRSQKIEQKGGEKNNE